MTRFATSALISAACALAMAAATTQAATFVWDGAPDTSGSSANNFTRNGDNWVGDVAPGDAASNDHWYTGTPAQTTIFYGGGTGPTNGQINNDADFLTFDAALTTDLIFTGAFRANDDPNFRQNSARAIDIQSNFYNLASINGSGSGTVTFSGNLARANGDNAAAFTMNNAGFDIVYSGSISAGNEWWRITKQGAGKLTVSGNWGMIDTSDFAMNHHYLKLEAGTTDVSGTVNGSTINVNGGTFQGIGTLGFYIQDTANDLIDFNSGTLNLSGLTIDFQALGLGVTQAQYVLVDYAGADLGGADSLILASNLATGNTFGAVTNLPTGYKIFHDSVNSQILLQVIPEPASMAILALGGLMLLPRRRR